jgi:hypothetical protein
MLENPDVKLCIEALGSKAIEHTLRWNYYDGKHRLAFVNPKLSEVIKNSVVFVRNWCQVIVNAARDRMNIDDWKHDNETVAEALDDIWEHTLQKAAQRIHVSTLVTGESYVVAWPDKQGVPRAYYHDPRQVHVVYEDDDPETARMACKTWIGKVNDKSMQFLNLYYPDRIEHYATTNTSGGTYAGYQTMGNAPIEPNMYGQIPVFHFQLDKRVCVGELTLGVLSLQDAMNKLLNDMMVASEYSSFAQRWVIGNLDPKSKLTVSPGSFATFPGTATGDQPTSTGTYPTTPPDNYLKPLDNMALSMAALSATPKHFFAPQAGDPSGEALRAMEAPLIAKVRSYFEILGEPWANLAAFMLKLSGCDVTATDIDVIWAEPTTVQPMTQAQTRLTNVQAGIPITNQLRDEGWDENELDQLALDANKMATMTAVPNVGAIPSGAPERVRIGATLKAKETLAERATPGLGEALEGAGQRAVEGVTQSGALQKMLNKYAGKRVRK